MMVDGLSALSTGSGNSNGSLIATVERHQWMQVA